MKRPAVLIVGAVAGALLVAGVGASAHTGLFVSKVAGLTTGTAGEEASPPRVEPSETPEPTETPKAQPVAEPTETPEAADTENENSDEQGDNETGDHEGGSGSGSSGGGDHGD